MRGVIAALPFPHEFLLEALDAAPHSPERVGLAEHLRVQHPPASDEASQFGNVRIAALHRGPDALGNDEPVDYRARAGAVSAADEGPSCACRWSQRHHRPGTACD